MADTSHTDSSYDLVPKAPEAPAPQPPAEVPLRPAPEAPVSLPAVPPAQPWTCTICRFTADARPRRGNCPECGAPTDPRGTGLLQYSIPSWIRYLSTGVIILFLAILLHVIAVFVAFAWDAFRPGTILQLVAACLEFAAVWIVTSREPHPQATRPTLALPARLAALVAFVVFALMARQGYRDLDVTKNMITLALFAAAAIAFPAGFQLSHLAVRIPSDSLASHTLNLAWIIAVACVFLAALNMTNFLHVINDPSIGRLFMFTFPIAALLIAVVAWAEWVLLRLYINLNHCAVAAATPPRRRAAPNPSNLL